jgi:hypothetical protein
VSQQAGNKFATTAQNANNGSGKISATNMPIDSSNWPASAATIKRQFAASFKNPQFLANFGADGDTDSYPTMKNTENAKGKVFPGQNFQNKK